MTSLPVQNSSPKTIRFKDVSYVILPISTVVAIVVYLIASNLFFIYDQYLANGQNHSYISERAGLIQELKSRPGVYELDVQSGDVKKPFLVFKGHVEDRSDYLDIRQSFSDSELLKFQPVWQIKFDHDRTPNRNPQFAKVASGSARAMYIRGTVSGLITGTAFAVTFLAMSMWYLSRLKKNGAEFVDEV